MQLSNLKITNLPLVTKKGGFTPHLCKGAGFTLIEIAIILVIIGILVSLGVALIGPLTKRAKYIESKEIVNAATESVISYGASNKKLPLQDEFVEIVRNPKDAWTKTLYYIVDSNLTTIPTGSIDAICGRKTTDLTICRDATCTVATNITNVAFIVISGADNYNVQTGIITAAPCPSGKTCVRVYEVDTLNIDDCTNSTNCPNYPSAEMINRPEPYDDVIKWVTLDELRIKTGCVGAQLKILNNELPPGFRCSAYTATIIADGGVPYSSGGKYRWCTQGTLPGGLTLNPNTTSSDCSGLDEASWGQADNLTLSAPSGALYQYGTFSLTFFVRDNNDPSGNQDNTSQKTFVLTISVQATGFRVWNTAGGKRDFMVDGVCQDNVKDGEEVTQPADGHILNAGETIDRYDDKKKCETFQLQLTYDQAVAADSNCNFEVNFTLTGASDR